MCECHILFFFLNFRWDRLESSPNSRYVLFGSLVGGSPVVGGEGEIETSLYCDSMPHTAFYISAVSVQTTLFTMYNSSSCTLYTLYNRCSVYEAWYRPASHP